MITMVGTTAVSEIETSSLETYRGARLVDVREPDEFVGDLGRLPGAELVPLATLEISAAAWPRDQQFVVVCRSGGRSARGAAALLAMGFRRVVSLRGGMMAVNAAGLPVEKGPVR